MTRVYSNLPSENNDSLKKSIDELTNNQYVDPLEFNVGEYDATIGFFVKRGFDREPAEQLAYIILQQAKVDNINSQEVLQKLGDTNPAQLNEVVTMILNANRFRSSALGTRSKKTAKDSVSRNILG
jgi:hypothetical protein|tara:strand:- start:412 stop:789 length:378 start_codon:yes stop_codon:yes gene_type:complete